MALIKYNPKDRYKRVEDLRVKLNVLCQELMLMRGKSRNIGDIYASCGKRMLSQHGRRSGKYNGEYGYFLRTADAGVAHALASPPDPETVDVGFRAWQQLHSAITLTYVRDDSDEMLRFVAVKEDTGFRDANDMADAMYTVLHAIALGRQDVFTGAKDGGIISSEVVLAIGLARDAADRRLDRSPSYLEREAANAIDRMWMTRIAQALLDRKSAADAIAGALDDYDAGKKQEAGTALCDYAVAAGIEGATTDRMKWLLGTEPRLILTGKAVYREMYKAAAKRLEMVHALLRTPTPSPLPEQYGHVPAGTQLVLSAIAAAPAAPAAASAGRAQRKKPAPAPAGRARRKKPAAAPAAAVPATIPEGCDFTHLVYVPGIPGNPVRKCATEAVANSEARWLAIEGNGVTYVARIVGHVTPPKPEDLRVVPFGAG